MRLGFSKRIHVRGMLKSRHPFGTIHKPPIRSVLCVKTIIVSFKKQATDDRAGSRARRRPTNGTLV